MIRTFLSIISCSAICGCAGIATTTNNDLDINWKFLTRTSDGTIIYFDKSSLKTLDGPVKRSVVKSSNDLSKEILWVVDCSTKEIGLGRIYTSDSVITGSKTGKFQKVITGSVGDHIYKVTCGVL